MRQPLPILQQARIASPCGVSWASMRGDDRTRYCNVCEKNVFNLVGMSDEEVTSLIQEKEGSLCVRLYQRADGTLMTSDCPVGLRAVRRRLARAIGAMAACFGVLLTAATFGAAGRFSPWRLRDTQPFSRIANWLSPPAPLMGSICVPSVQPAGGGNPSAERDEDAIEEMTHEIMTGE